MRLPSPRGPVSAALCQMLLGDTLSSDRGVQPSGLVDLLPSFDEPADALVHADLQLALAICYELHYNGFEGVSDDWEWNPGLLTLRAEAERLFEAGLTALVGDPAVVDAATVPQQLIDLAADDSGPSLAKYIQRHATSEQFAEFVMQRSIYHLKEADPHTWAVPRLTGRTKAALLEIQIDEYGSGQLKRMHAQLFKVTMEHLGLDASYGAYIDVVPAVTLATNNLMSLFGLHRRHRGALIGHLAAFEMTSAIPNRRYGNGLRRLGGDAVATRYYDEHVEADAVHEQIAAHDMCGVFARENPAEAAEIIFGARCCLGLDRLFAEHLLDAWERSDTSLIASTEALAAQAG